MLKGIPLFASLARYVDWLRLLLYLLFGWFGLGAAALIDYVDIYLSHVCLKKG